MGTVPPDYAVRKLRKTKNRSKQNACSDNGASDEARTRYLHLGKVALYQMSYTRGDTGYYSRNRNKVNP